MIKSKLLRGFMISAVAALSLAAAAVAPSAAVADEVVLYGSGSVNSKFYAKGNPTTGAIFVEYPSGYTPPGGGGGGGGGGSLTASEAMIGHVGGNTIVGASSLTRSSNTTAYGIGQAICASTCAGIQIPVARINAGTALIRMAAIQTSATAVGYTVRVHVYQTCPTTFAADGAAFLTSVDGVELRQFDVVIGQAYTNGAKGWGGPNFGGEAIVKTATGTASICVLLESRSVFTPTSAGTFGVTLDSIAD